MFLSANQNKNIAKKWAFAIFVWLFIVIWVAGMFAGITAQACRNERNDGVKKLRFCNLSIIAGSLLPGAAGKRSILFLERGIAHAQLDASDKATMDMARALSDAADELTRQGAMFSEIWVQRLLERIEKEDPTSLAYSVWQKVQDDFEK